MVTVPFRSKLTVSVLCGLALLSASACDGQPGTSAPPPPAPPNNSEIPLYGIADIILRADTEYDARLGSPNPFDFRITATVRSPSGRERVVRGFFDGDGNGDPEGDVFRLRIQPDEEGVWSWRVASDLAALDGLEGDFECRGAILGPFARGGIIVDAEMPRYFAFRDGTPVFLIGKFLDVDAAETIQYSHTFFSERLTDEDRRQMLDRHLAMGLNKMNIYIANRGDYGGRWPTTPWVGTPSSNDKSRFALDRWHLFERWIGELRDAGMVAQLWFFADDSGFGRVNRSEKERLADYAMARLSAYTNTMFVLMLEWQEDWSQEEVEELGLFVQDRNPWQRLVSAHGRTGDFAFPGASWADYMDIQSGNSAGRNYVYDQGLRNRLLADKPLIQEEFGLGEETDENRAKTWAAYLSGAAGIGTGAFLLPFSKFIASIPFAALAPSPNSLVSGSAYVATVPGSLYVAYLPEGGQIELDTQGPEGTFTVTWFDPRNGSRTEAGTVEAGELARLDAPDSRDWVLILAR